MHLVFFHRFHILKEINVVQNIKTLSQNKGNIQKSKSKVPQTRISVAGNGNMPIIVMNPPQQQQQIVQPMQPANFKTFYNWNSAADYNYNIDLDNKNQRKAVIFEEANENTEEDNHRRRDNSPPKQYFDNKNKKI